MDQHAAFTLHARVAGAEVQLQFDDPDPLISQVAEELASRTGLAMQTLKLLGGGVKALVPSTAPSGAHCSSVGLKSGAKPMVMGSKATDVAALQSVKPEPRIRGFQEEAELAAARRRRTGSSQDVQPPPQGTKFTFGHYEVLQRPGLTPSPHEALKLLYRLAGDPGILHVMSKHQFTVGLLEEMPPEGLVAVDPVCVLGYNTNRGQSIHLRLRTDDLKGFRKYESIRQTLCHELTHNVWGDHDNNFKALCSQLVREVDEVHAQRRAAGHLALSDDPLADLHTWRRGAVALTEEPASSSTSHPAMAATAASSGKTLRQLAKEQQQQQQQPWGRLGQISMGGGGGGGVQVASPAVVLHGAGVLLALAPVATAPVAASREQERRGDLSGGQAAGSAADDSSEEDVARLWEHQDLRTEELERRQRALEQ